MLQGSSTTGIALWHAGLVQENALEHKSTGLVAHNAFRFRDAPTSKVSATAELLAGIGIGAGSVELLSRNSSEDSSPLIKAVADMTGLASREAPGGGKMQTAIALASQGIPAIGQAVTSSVVSTVMAGAGELPRLRGTVSPPPNPLSSHVRWFRPKGSSG